MKTNQPQKVQYFNGIHFILDTQSGYYRNSTIHKNMHRFVWEYYNGPIQNGFEIHHKDGDKSNNDISNLQCLSQKEHKKIHSINLTEEQREWRRKNLNENARPKAIEWHKSLEGRKWHSEHAKNQVRPVKHNICNYCGKKFDTIGYKFTKYCSGKCRMAYRRKFLRERDLETRVCLICGKEFKTNKYHKVVTCSRNCAVKLNWRNRNENKKSNKNS